MFVSVFEFKPEFDFEFEFEMASFLGFLLEKKTGRDKPTKKARRNQGKVSVWR